MTDAEAIGIGRRAFLAGLGGAAGLAMAGGVAGVPRWLGGRRHPDLGYEACLARLDASLTPAQRAWTVRAFDHPSRQITNTVSVFRTPHIGTLFDAQQISWIHRLYETMVADAGRARLENTVTLEGRLEGCVFAIFSDAEPGHLADSPARTQAMITGGHVLLRRGGRDASGYAMGGPVAYGQQLGDHRFKVEGNAFAVHSDGANALYASLDDAERARARVPTPPHELMVQPQGADGSFPGLSVGRMSGASRELTRALIDLVLETYPEADRRDAWTALERNGGLDALHVAFYENRGFYEDGARYDALDPAQRAARRDPYFQVWRVEGPGAVIHFKGWPHVHAYVDIVHDPRRQNVGEVLTRAAAPIADAGLRRLYVEALRHGTEAPHGFVPTPLPARVAAGDVTTGLVHALDPFHERIVIAHVADAALTPELKAALRGQGGVTGQGGVHAIATHHFAVRGRKGFGDVERVEETSLAMRDVLTPYLRGRDLGGFHG